MAVVALQHCGQDPSFAIGGELNESGTNAHHGHDGVFVAEADESDGSFLAYHPQIAVVTNVEADHLDHYGTEEAVHEAFRTFLYGFRHDAHPMAMLVGMLGSMASFYHNNLDYEDPEQRRLAVLVEVVTA